MIRPLVAALCLCLAFSAPTSAFAAACVTTKTGTYNWKIVCADGTEDAPTAVTEGIPVDGLRTVSVQAVADSSQTFTATPSGTVAIYTYSPNSALWGRCYDCNEATIKAVSQRTESLGTWTISGPGRIMFVSSGITLSSGGVTFYVDGGK